jgi:hypothetical protein
MVLAPGITTGDSNEPIVPNGELDPPKVSHHPLRWRPPVPPLSAFAPHARISYTRKASGGRTPCLPPYRLYRFCIVANRKHPVPGRTMHSVKSRISQRVPSSIPGVATMSIKGLRLPPQPLFRCWASRTDNPTGSTWAVVPQKPARMSRRLHPNLHTGGTTERTLPTKMGIRQRIDI